MIELATGAKVLEKYFFHTRYACWQRSSHMPRKRSSCFRLMATHVPTLSNTASTPWLPACQAWSHKHWV